MAFEVLVYQAEDCTSSKDCRRNSENEGYTGTGYMDYGGNGSWIEWNNVTIPKDGFYLLNFRYASASSDRSSDIIVNGTKVDELKFSKTGAWTEWRTDLTMASLNKGNNTIRVMAGSRNGGPRLDRMEVGSTEDIAREMLQALKAL